MSATLNETNILLVRQPGWARDALCTLLRAEPDLALKAVWSAPEPMSMLSFEPAVVLYNVGVPTQQSLDVTRQLAARFPRAAVLCMARCAEQRQVDDFIAAGARGCVVEGANAQDLYAAIRGVARGERLVPRVTEQHTHLSPRETDVLHWLAQGLTSKEIATRLDVAVSTVETYRKQLMTKLDLHSVATLTRFAIRSGIAPLE